MQFSVIHLSVLSLSPSLIVFECLLVFLSLARSLALSHQRPRSDLAKNIEENENFMKVLQTGMLEGARNYFVAGDPDVDLGRLYLVDSDDLKDTNVPQCWYGIEADLVGLNKAVWLEIMTKFNCKALLVWTSCVDQRERELLHKVRRLESTAIVVGYHVGPRNTKRTCYIHSETKLRSTWDQLLCVCNSQGRGSASPTYQDTLRMGRET